VLIGCSGEIRNEEMKTREVVVTARTDDYDEIVRVVQLYVDGFNDNDINKFKEAFDEDAWMYYIKPDGSLYKDLISKSFSRSGRRHPVRVSSAASSRLLK
jgi:hypothetical protein